MPVSNIWIIYMVMLIAGIGIPIMASINAGLGKHLASPSKAAFVLFCVGLISVTIALIPKGIPTFQQFRNVPVYYFLGGVFVAFYILSMTWAVPKIGVSTAVFFVLVGQIMAAILMEHFGLLGNAQVPIDIRRPIGLIFIVLGVYLARKP